MPSFLAARAAGQLPRVSCVLRPVYQKAASGAIAAGMDRCKNFLPFSVDKYPI